MTIAHPSSIAKGDDALSTVLNRRRQGLFDTRSVISEVAGAVLSLCAVAIVGGVWTIAVVVPNKLATVERELQHFSVQSAERLRRLEENDQTQDDRLLRLEDHKR